MSKQLTVKYEKWHQREKEFQVPQSNIHIDKKGHITPSKFQNTSIHDTIKINHFNKILFSYKKHRNSFIVHSSTNHVENLIAAAEVTDDPT